MSDFEWEIKRSEMICDMLNFNHKLSESATLFISMYLFNNEYKYSVRTAAISNRYNNLSFKTLMFVIRQFKLINDTNQIEWFKMPISFYSAINQFIAAFKKINENSSEETQLMYFEKISEYEADVLLNKIRSNK